MRAMITQLLKNNLPGYYYYHNYEHTLYVTDKAVQIAINENCTEREIELITAAALWHDTGFLNTYSDHEEESCTLAQAQLPEYGFSSEDIQTICGMIMATRLPQQPKNRLEEIVADADLEYLGTEDAASKAEALFKEWKHVNPSLTRKEWNKKQILFLQEHHYFTSYCKKNREEFKTGYLRRLLLNSGV